MCLYCKRLKKMKKTKRKDCDSFFKCFCSSKLSPFPLIYPVMDGLSEPLVVLDSCSEVLFDGSEEKDGRFF